MDRPQAPSSYEWFAPGDINGFFGLLFDNLTVLSFLAGILIFAFHFPAEIVYRKMFPGTALGVMAGDLAYTVMAFRLAWKTGKRNITAMPLGLDTPSTLGIALTVLGPAFLAMKARGLPEGQAALMTWYIGMSTMVTIGLIKFVFSFFGAWIQKLVPEAGLLGSLAGIGLALIGLIPLVDIFSMPLIGILALGIVLYNLVAKLSLPRNFPGVLAAVLAGTTLYYLSGATYAPPADPMGLSVPLPSLHFLQGFKESLTYLPIALPFAILTIVGGINVTESARVAGDDFKTRHILLTDAFATLLAGLSGGVAQSTPYIGQPAYKHMGCRAGYTLLTGLAVGLGGMLGAVGFIVNLIPRAVLAPILLFVAIEIMCQAFDASPKRHAPAVALAYFPAAARLLQIKLSNPAFVSPQNFQALISEPGKSLPELLVTIALGNGFILTAMLWGAALAMLIDRRLRAAGTYLAVLAGLSFFGFIHSAKPDGSLYLPWTLALPARQIPYQFGAAYAIMAATLLAVASRRPPSAEVPS